MKPMHFIKRICVAQRTFVARWGVISHKANECSSEQSIELTPLIAQRKIRAVAYVTSPRGARWPTSPSSLSAVTHSSLRDPFFIGG
jgi:hypothetical protein